MSSVCALRSEEVHLWFTFYDEIRDRDVLDNYRAIVSMSEKQQEARFVFDRDRHLYLVTRMLVRSVLSKYVPIAPSEWTFSANEYGRPVVANTRTAGRWPVFNVSHSEGLIVMAVSGQRGLGVDTENVISREAPLDIAERYFSPREVADLRCLRHDLQPQRFYDYWTLKEAYIKARGMGLTLPLDRFSFGFPTATSISFSTDNDVDRAPERWCFSQLSPSASFVVSLCAETGVPGCRPAIRTFEITPLLGERKVQTQIVRQTQPV